MIQTLFKWYGKKRVIAFFAVLVVILIVGVVKITSHSESVTDDVIKPPVVQLSLVSALSNNATFNLIGSVEAVNEVRLESEAAGRVTGVFVAIGDTVESGTTIAKIENASQYASLLQAEGSYEAALAIAAQSDVSVQDAETSLLAAKNAGLNTYRSAFTTTDDVIRNMVDDLFSNPGESSSGFRLDSLGRATYLTEERRGIEVLLDTWSSNTFVEQNADDALASLTAADANIRRVALFVEEISGIVSDDENENASIAGVGIETYKTSFLGARSSLNAVLQSVTAARTSIENAEEGLERARISGTNTEVSVANAQVKQALGALRVAQASFAKTIIRTPMSGTVNKVDVQEGDFIGMFTPVATIANNNALEITTYVGEADQTQLVIGDTVLVEGLYEGTVTNIAPAIDPVTKKVEVKIQTATDMLENGDTVRISIDGKVTDVDSVITVPLTAIKFSATDGSVFTVKDNVIVAHRVVLGGVTGAHITVLEGVTSDMEIIIDARGLNAGQSVEALRN